MLLVLSSCRNPVLFKKRETDMLAKEFVEIHFQAGFLNDTVKVSTIDGVLYSKVLSTDWSLGYAGRVVINNDSINSSPIYIQVNSSVDTVYFLKGMKYMDISYEHDSVWISFSKMPHNYM
jgi:hypothetical protein